MSKEDHLEVLRADTSDLPQLIAAFRERMAGQTIAGVMSSSDYFVAAAANRGRRTGLAWSLARSDVRGKR